MPVVVAPFLSSKFSCCTREKKEPHKQEPVTRKLLFNGSKCRQNQTLLKHTLQWNCLFCDHVCRNHFRSAISLPCLVVVGYECMCLLSHLRLILLRTLAVTLLSLQHRNQDVFRSLQSRRSFRLGLFHVLRRVKMYTKHVGRPWQRQINKPTRQHRATNFPKCDTSPCNRNHSNISTSS